MGLSPALRIAGIYFILAALWIQGSDHFLSLLTSDPQVLVALSKAKGLFFVSTTTLILYFLVRSSFNTVQSSYEALQRAEALIALEQKRAQEALIAINRSLESKVAERTKELKIAAQKAESADRLKSTFLATMSHELRTPLNSIIGFTGILLQELAGPVNPEQDKQLRMVQSSSRHLLALINDVLDLSKIEAGQMTLHFQTFSVPELVKSTCESLESTALQKGLKFSFEVDPEVTEIESDPRRVQQILLNLANNAIKFTDSGEVCLAANNALSERGLTLEVSVRDTGIGIKQGDLDKLFKAFAQVDTGLTRQHEGTGLGLAISRRLTELLGGELKVESQWEAGSVFTLVLPYQSPETSSKMANPRGGVDSLTKSSDGSGEGDRIKAC